MPTACQKGGQRMSLLRPHVHLQLAHCLHARMSGTGRQPEEGKLRRGWQCVWWVKWKRKKCEQVHSVWEWTVITGYPLVACLCILFLWNLIMPKLKANLEMVFSHIMVVCCGRFGWAPSASPNIFNIHEVFGKFGPRLGLPPLKKSRIDHWIL